MFSLGTRSVGDTLTSLCWEVNEEAQSVSCSITITGIERGQAISSQLTEDMLIHKTGILYIQVISCTVLARPLFNGRSCTEHAYCILTWLHF